MIATQIATMDHVGARVCLCGTASLHAVHSVDSPGLLQSFVLPGSEYNEVLQAVWSPKICHVNKRINRWKLSDRAHARSVLPHCGLVPRRPIAAARALISVGGLDHDGIGVMMHCRIQGSASLLHFFPNLSALIGPDAAEQSPRMC